MTLPDYQIEPMAQQIARSTVREGGGILDRDELAQAARIGIWKASESFDSGRGVPIAKWVRLKGYGAARDAVRRERRRSGPTVPVRDRHITASMNTAAIDLKRAISTLGDPDKPLVILLYREGCTLQEAAVEFRVSVGTISTWRDRAIDRLRQALGAA
jgi:RNA polymerase sigma factor (sigma-70 family)